MRPRTPCSPDVWAWMRALRRQRACNQIALPCRRTFGLERFGSDGGSTRGDGRGGQVGGSAGVDDGRVPGHRPASLEGGNRSAVASGGRRGGPVRVAREQPESRTYIVCRATGCAARRVAAWARRRRCRRAFGHPARREALHRQIPAAATGWPRGRPRTIGSSMLMKRVPLQQSTPSAVGQCRGGPCRERGLEDQSVQFVPATVLRQVGLFVSDGVGQCGRGRGRRQVGQQHQVRWRPDADSAMDRRQCGLKPSLVIELHVHDELQVVIVRGQFFSGSGSRLEFTPVFPGRGYSILAILFLG